MSDNEKRTFEVIQSSSGKIGGRYVSKTPAGAARKAGSKLVPTNGPATLSLSMKETTRGSKHKEFTYEWSRIEQLDTVNINGKEVVYKYKTKVIKI